VHLKYDYVGFNRHHGNHHDFGCWHQGIGEFYYYRSDYEGCGGLHVRGSCRRVFVFAFLEAELLAPSSIPPNTGEMGTLWLVGNFAGSGRWSFFAYIGFDAVSTAAQEAKNPKRDMPFGILGSLIICTVLYIWFQACSLTSCLTSSSTFQDPVVVGVEWRQQWATFLVEMERLAVWRR